MCAVETTEHVLFRRPAHVVADEEVQQAIAIVVKPERGSAEALVPKKAAHARRIHKRSFAGVSKKPALSHACDENVRKSVVVVVANSHTHAVHLDIQARAFCHIGKRAVTIVPVKPESGTQAFVSGPVRSVDEKNVLPAIAVVIEECTARTQRFGQELAAVTATVVPELNAGRGGHVRKAKREAGYGFLLNTRGRQCRSKSSRASSQQEIPTNHGSVTRPLRIA